MKERRIRVISNIIIACVLACALGVTLYATLPSPVQSVASTAVYSGDEKAGAVALMVNVYEGTEYALKMAETLSARGYSTTFFVGGKWVEKNGNALIQLATIGMEIGNHGYLHRDHAKLNYKQNTDEIILCERLLDNYLSSVPGYENSKLFAPPSGSLGDAMFSACADNGYTVIMWTRDTIDWRDHDSDLIFARAVKGIKSGDLILMHPTACTLAALPRILDEIESKGLKVDKVSKVIK